MIDVEKIVYERYPVSKKERRCAYEKARMEALRKLFRKRIIDDNEREKKIFERDNNCEPQV